MRETMTIALQSAYLFFLCLLICFLSCLTACTFNINLSDNEGGSKMEVEQTAEQPTKLNPEISANLLKL